MASFIVFLIAAILFSLINESKGGCKQLNNDCDTGKQDCCGPNLQCCQLGVSTCTTGKCCIKNGKESATDGHCCSNKRTNKGGKMLCV
ncbi:hypothetical protein Mgra_00003709 [Meloidogyne graminicola]|uniref:Uncharacterized protein n=1 Tax=Meloidogyne graminicola TaxID=189291 RepID=A0A2R4SDE6_9BILA|nr:hypothetical protein [Meloidogyne graminicola]KAF7636763.1 hypothetical protein Mgra_00003709 [Meloidogyne graminicola]